MVTGAEERNSDILRVFKTAGDSISEDKHFLPLKWILEGEDPFYTGSEAGEEAEDDKNEEENGNENWTSFSRQCCISRVCQSSDSTGGPSRLVFMKLNTKPTGLFVLLPNSRNQTLIIHC